MDDKKRKLTETDDRKATLIRKALTDNAFMKELRGNPNAAIEKATGVKIPAGVTIQVVQDTADVVHLVLPFAGAGPAVGKPAADDLGKSADLPAMQTMIGRCSDDSTTYKNPCAPA